jgi:hypothetical protein
MIITVYFYWNLMTLYRTINNKMITRRDQNICRTTRFFQFFWTSGIYMILVSIAAYEYIFFQGHTHTHTCYKDYAMTQADRCCFLTTGAWVQSWVISRVIHDAQIVTGESFFPNFFGFLLIIIILSLLHTRLWLPHNMWNIITFSIFKFGASSLTRRLAGYRVRKVAMKS